MSEQFNPFDWITSREAADLTGYTKNAFINAVNRGTLDAIKRGSMLFYKRLDILTYVKLMRDLGPKKYIPKRFQEQTQDEQSNE